MALNRYARTRLPEDLHGVLLFEADLRRMTVSRLIRAILADRYRGTPMPRTRLGGPAEAVARELNRIGVNLNQLAHVANATHSIDRIAFDDLAKKLIAALERL
ncbi:MAG: plasmid mobilization relaxosome protein MobC [Hyphomicrobiaceae bacterium]